MNWGREKWRKLYVREEGTFSQLPLFARALSAMLLKLADDNGEIHIGGNKTFEEVVAWRLGATRGDRRLLRSILPLLLEDGYIVQEGNRVSIRNFEQAQGRTRMGNDAAATVQRPSNDGVTTGPPPSNEKPPNYTEPIESGCVVERREEEIRKEGRGEAKSSPKARQLAVEIFVEDPSPVVLSLLYRDGSVFPVTEDMIAKYRITFPRLPDLESHLRRLRLWLEDNPTKRSHNPSGMRQRISKWLGRDEDEAVEAARVHAVNGKSKARPLRVA